MKIKKFVEDFVCDNCGQRVEGDGYTDHCPFCLWGKHMDEELPGDRASGCQGMMKPICLLIKNGEQKIKYKCQKCNHEFIVKIAENDNKDKLLELSCGINSE
jgi:DNA-directed RNA polymerase subunit RPC12/RpoP